MQAVTSPPLSAPHPCMPFVSTSPGGARTAPPRSWGGKAHLETEDGSWGAHPHPAVHWYRYSLCVPPQLAGASTCRGTRFAPVPGGFGTVFYDDGWHSSVLLCSVLVVSSRVGASGRAFSMALRGPFVASTCKGAHAAAAQRREIAFRLGPRACAVTPEAVCPGSQSGVDLPRPAGFGREVTT